AEDGIRDKLVTGVQTCALPIWAILVVYLGMVLSIVGIGLLIVPPIVSGVNNLTHNLPGYVEDLRKNKTIRRYDEKYHIVDKLQKIGRASCRERVEITEGAVGGT